MAPRIKDPLDLRAERARLRQRRYRAGIRVAKPKRSVYERLLDRLDREPGVLVRPALGPCWEWRGAKNGDGYGVIKGDDGKLAYCHRVALEAAMGRPIAPGMLACHKCDNRRCARPAHLYEGSPSENTQDSWTRTRGRPDALETWQAEGTA